MTFVTKKSLHRRTFLRGVGATVSLPLLDAMIPALSAKPLKSTPRLGFIYIANGVIQDQWIPKTTGRNFALSPILQHLEPVKNHINVLSGLSHLQADTFGDGTGDHPRSSAVWLTGVHAYDRSRPDIEVHLATSADQIAARVIGKTTQTPSVEINLDLPTQGACDTSDCFFNNTISWRNPSTPNPAEAHPRVVFERLFGDGGSPEQRTGADEAQRQHSRFRDGRSQRSQQNAGTGRPHEAERVSGFGSRNRTAHSRRGSAGVQSIELPERPTDIPGTFEEHIKLMFDLQALGFQADATRVFTMIVCRELSARTYPQIGVPDQHHPMSHHRNDPALIVKKAKIDTYHVQLLGYFLQKLQATQDGDGSLARPESDSLRRRHGRRQSASALQSALPDGRETGRAIRDRTASGLSEWTRRCRICC